MALSTISVCGQQNYEMSDEKSIERSKQGMEMLRLNENK
jgi:hypothetical protein